MSIREAVEHAAFTSTQGGVKVAFTSDAGSVYVSEFLFDEGAGFSALMKMFERDPKAEVGVVTLRAPLVGLSAPDSMLGYPPDVVLHPALFIRNASPTKTDIALQVAWKSPTSSGTIPLKVGALKAEETRVVDLARLQQQGLPADANWANVSLSYSGRPGDLVPIATSYDSTTRYGLQSPFSSTLGAMWKGGMWHVDALHDSLITTGNAGTRNAKIVVTLFYGSTGVYDMPVKEVAPGGQVWVDVGELIRDQVPDAHGKVMPPDTMEGSYEIRDDGDKNIGYLYEGKVITDKTFGHATYGCGSCCGYDDSYMLPDPMIGPIGFGDSFTVYGVNACTGQGVALGGAYNWSGGLPVATVSSSGYVTMVSTGSSSVSSYIKLRTAGVNNCPLQQYSQSAPVDVVQLACSPSSVSRGGSSTCTLTGSSGVAASNWQFSDGTNSAVVRSTNTSSLTWTGTMVTTGTVSVTASYSGASVTLSALITVTNRNWHTTPATPSEVANGTFISLPVPPQPTGLDSGLGESQEEVGNNSFASTFISDSGPNNGYGYYATQPTLTTTYNYEINPDLENTMSTFYLKQCGNYNSQTNPGGCISGGNLLTQTRRHEYNSATESHYAFYSNSISGANNPGDYIELRVAAPGTSPSAFDSATGAGLSDPNTGLYKKIFNDFSVEPYGVNSDANGNFLGNINYSPYTTCSC